jgi:trimeric autotransporter adhesin
MAITVKHSKTSAIADAGDATLVQPSDWNADHTLTGTIDIANGGTGQTTANAAFNALAPSQTGNTGKVLTSDGTNATWATNGTGTVTSVATGTGLTGGPITTSGTIAIDSTVATLTGTQTLTNKTLTSPIVNEILDANGNEVLGLLSTASATDYVGIKNGIGVGVPLHISSEGSSANIGLHIQPKGTGLVTISDGTDFNKGIRFRSSGSAASAITLLDAVSTAGHVITLPDATTTLVGRNTTDTLTNKSISGSTNTLSNIGNASLTNSAITINGTSTSLGGSISVGTVTSVTGTAPVVSSGGATPAISIPAATTSVDGYLTSTDWNTFNNKGSGTVTSVSATSPITSTGGVTPTIAMPAATTSVNGYLTSTDWTTFNNKGSGTVTSVSGTGTVSGISLSGTVTSIGNLTLGGTLDLSSPPAIGGTSAAAITGTTITATRYVGISGGTF